MAMQQGRPHGNGHVLPRASESDGAPREVAQKDLPPIGRVRPGEGLSTGEALAAVARDAIDVASELVRDGITLGRLEAQRAVSDMAPRVAWGALTLACAGAGGVLAIIAATMALGAVIPSVAARLAILAAALFVVAFFGAVRFLRPAGQHSEAANTKESAQSERRNEDFLHAPRPGSPVRSHLPPFND